MTMVPKSYFVLQRAVEEGIACGLRYAFKHNEYPNQTDIEENVQREVMNAIAEIFDFVSEPA